MGCVREGTPTKGIQGGIYTRVGTPYLHQGGIYTRLYPPREPKREIYPGHTHPGRPKSSHPGLGRRVKVSNVPSWARKEG